MEPVNLFRIVVASPGDVQAERDALPAVLEELPRGIAATQNLRLELGHWETDAFPGFHCEGPQGLIDPILRIEDCDVLQTIPAPAGRGESLSYDGGRLFYSTINRIYVLNPATGVVVAPAVCAAGAFA